MTQETNNIDKHMGWRGSKKNYRWPGTYHITISVAERQQQPLGHLVGDASKSDGDPDAPRILLSDIGMMVEHELLNGIRTHYPMVEVQDYVIMPDHLHFIVVVHHDIVSSNGRATHLGQVIAGFKKGCNRHYWELIGLSPHQGPNQGLYQYPHQLQGEPAPASTLPAPLSAPVSIGPLPASLSSGSAATGSFPGSLPTSGSSGSAAKGSFPGPLHAVHPQGKRTPSDGTTNRPPLFSYGYVDVMPLEEGQLERQREYIHNNPRYRLLRAQNPSRLHTQRGGVNTALSPTALKGYLQRECSNSQFDQETWAQLQQRLLINPTTNHIDCDTYGNRQLLSGRLLPVVCHRRDTSSFTRQKSCCLAAAASGAVLVSGRIAKGEQDIIDTAIAAGYPVIILQDNGFPDLYHPSERLTNLCANSKLLMVTPWKYAYRRVNDAITVAECKTLNCLAQALCRTKDTWWQQP